MNIELKYRPESKKETLYKVGDQVEIVNYGHIMWSSDIINDLKIYSKEKELYLYDTCPELVGQKGIIIKAHKTQGKDTYSLKGVNKTAWYNNNQLKLIHRPEYK